MENWRCMLGWPREVAVQPRNKKMRRQGRRWEAMKRMRERKKVARKMVDDRGSLEKLVGGVMVDITLSCRREKSSMLF